MNTGDHRRVCLHKFGQRMVIFKSIGRIHMIRHDREIPVAASAARPTWLRWYIPRATGCRPSRVTYPRCRYRPGMRFAAGHLDMVGMTRAHMADPHIVRKITEGREAEIRPCTGANYCLDRIYQGGMALCIHNAATGREETMPHDIAPAATPRHVVVIGAVPAGLEAARVAAMRGHVVTVLEAADAPGGQIRLTTRSARRSEMMGIVDWRMARCEDMGVTFRFSTLAEAEDVEALSPDVVIVATGGMAHTQLYETHTDQPNVVTSWDILSGDVNHLATY